MRPVHYSPVSFGRGGGGGVADQTAKSHDDINRRRWVWRALDLVGPRGRFLRRRGLDLPLFGVYVHDIEQPDPGLDLHDHPWPFVTIVVRGGYSEEYAHTRDASAWAGIAEELDESHGPAGLHPRGLVRTWRRGSIHRIRMTEAHRIIVADPGTRTILLRGRKTRGWGFYLPIGWIDQTRYDYDARRPIYEVRS